MPTAQSRSGGALHHLQRPAGSSFACSLAMRLCSQYRRGQMSGYRLATTVWGTVSYFSVLRTSPVFEGTPTRPLTSVVAILVASYQRPSYLKHITQFVVIMELCVASE
jgi:hypothetical protein